MLTNALALVIMAASKNVVTLAVGVGLLGLGEGICLQAGPPQIVRHWFHKHQGTVLGFITAATGLGGSALCLVFSGIIEAKGWQSAFLCGGILFSLVAVLTFAIIRNHPEEKGLKPYGESQHTYKKQKVTLKWEGFSMAQLTRMPSFYLLLLGSFFSCFCFYTLWHTIVPHLRNEGFTAIQATSVQSALLLVLTCAKLGVGGLCDRIGGKWIALLCLSCSAAGLGLMAFSHNTYLMWAAALLLSCGAPLTTLTIPLLTLDLFGYRTQAMAVGFFMSTVSVGAMVAVPIANAVFDKLGTYRPVYAVAALVTLGLIGLYGSIYLMVGRAKNKLCV